MFYRIKGANYFPKRLLPVSLPWLEEGHQQIQASSYFISSFEKNMINYITNVWHKFATVAEI